MGISMQYKHGLILKIQAQIQDVLLSSRPFSADIIYSLPLAHTHERGPSLDSTSLLNH